MQDSLLLSYVSLVTTALMILISGLLYYNGKDKSQWISFEYWVAAFCHVGLSMLTAFYGPLAMAMSLLIWPWRLRTIRRILETTCGPMLNKKWYLQAFFFSYLLQLVLYYSGFNFQYYTFPVAFTVFVIILHMLIISRVRAKKNELTLIHYILQINIFIIALHNLDYPFLRQHIHYSKLASSVSLLTSVLMAIILPAVVIYNLKIRRQKELEEILINQSKLSTLGEMTAGIAHEINNPLGVIINRVALIKMQMKKQNSTPEDIIKGLNQVESTAKRITEIISSLKKFSRTEKEENFKEVNLRMIIEETLTYCRDRFRLANIDLRITADNDFMISCRPVQISQVLLNLLNNSFDAVKGTSNPWVEIKTLAVNNSVRMIVKDSGPGIPLEIRKNIMTLFFTTKELEGTGLGLPLSRTMIEEHGGSLYYDESESNTTFVVEVPLSTTHH